MTQVYHYLVEEALTIFVIIDSDSIASNYIYTLGDPNRR